MVSLVYQVFLTFFLRTTSPPAQKDFLPDSIGLPRITIAFAFSEFEKVRIAEPKSVTIEKFKACKAEGRSKVITRMA